VLPDPGAVHVCYCHNPFRYAWSEREATLAARSVPMRLPLQVVLSRWRRWDWIAAQRVDRYVANSRLTAARVRRYFGREADVLHPPVELERFSPGRVGEHYLVVAELMAHKRIDVAIEAFNRLRLPLVVAGDGPDARRLRRLGGPTVRFAGRVSDEAAADLLASCRALVVPAVEEFGIAAVEAQAAGRPVLSVRGGGALETIREGVTGAFWEGGPAELAIAVGEFDDAGVDPRACVESAARFDASVFREELPLAVEQAVHEADARAQPGAPRPPRIAHGSRVRRGLARPL
jgi:glycosyltransferase involved in cell wall biosynthesis